MASDSQIPSIRTFQFDSSAFGNLKSSVNLFRGDINFTQTLFSMPGRVSGDGMDVTVALLYQSNVFRDGQTWNRDNPTGVVGLGWSLPTTSIQLDDSGSVTPGTRTYQYVSGGSPAALAREPETPFLFSMPSSLSSGLSGGTVSADVVARFASNGIALATTAKVTAVSSTQWAIADDDNQQLFNLQLDGGGLDAYDGGESFQLVNYQFWKILYYAPYERWVVINESGQKMSFGGRGPDTPRGYATSAGNSIEWGVRWYVPNAETGQPEAIWEGDSNLTQGQGQYARAWHLVSAMTPWGDSIRYSYNGWDRNSAGLIPDVEQQVGAGGLPYTKACYLTGITDVFGRTLTFNYEDKLWSNATPESAREYADPHKAVPDNTPNAYQDRYETRYLDNIVVKGLDGSTLFSLKLLYQPKQPAGGVAGSPVANVTTHTGALFGDTCKRILTRVVLSNAFNDSLPGIVFDYYFDSPASSNTASSPGALKSITYPQGGAATYSYTKQSLDICDRTYAVPQPSDPGFAGSTPRVFFGEDYAVTTWYSAASGKLSMQVYTWLGRWESWSLTPDTVLFNDSAGLDLSTLEVVPSGEFFALSFERVNETDVYIFQKDVARPGQWVPATLNGTTTGVNTPALSYTTTSATAVLSGGDTFLLVTLMDEIHGKYSYDRVTWRWTTNAWTRESFTLPAFAWGMARNEYYLLLDQRGTASLYFLDPALVWNGPRTVSIPDFSVQDLSRITLVPSDSFVIAANLTGQNSQQLSYTLHFLQWDAAYGLQSPPAQFSFSDRQEPSGAFPTPWVPVVISNTLVAAAARVLRFNGQTWLVNSGLYNGNPQSGRQQRYAYGPDYALQIVADGNGVGAPAAKVLSFDPDTDTQGWTRAPVTPAQSLPVPPQNSKTANWPSAGAEDYCVLGQFLYFRGSATHWDGVMAGSPTADVQALVNQSLGATNRFVLNSQAVVNEAPRFLSYFVFDTQGATGNQVAATVLMNGQVSGAAQPLSDERMSTPSEPGGGGPGTAAGGPSAFAGYPSTASGFNQATQIILHRYAGEAIEGELLHYAVTGLTVDDGFDAPSPHSYVPDPSNAACDPSGDVVKYFTSTVYPGTADPSRPVFGSVVNRYLNGLGIRTGADFYNMLDGLLAEVDVLDNQGNILTKTTNDWHVYIQRASEPVDGSAQPLNLRGGFVVQLQQTKVEDGVTSSQQTAYVPEGFTAPYSGQPVATTTRTVGGTGAAETFIATSQYGYEVDNPAISGPMRALHLLNDVAQSVTTWTRGTGEAIPAKGTATTYRSFPSALGANVLVPGKEADFSWVGPAGVPFPFNGYSPGTAPDGWLLSRRVVARTPFGQTVEQWDGLGVPMSTLYGTDDTFPVAVFNNASFLGGGCAYCGFEPYEGGGGWTAQGTRTVTGDAHTGQSSLSLPAGGGASLSARLTPPNVSQTYLLGFWYKTPAGFTPVTGAGFSVTVSVDGVAGTPLTAAFADTGGTWAYRTLGIPLTAGTSSIALSVQAANPSQSAVLLDDVFVAPLTGRLAARTYDPGSHLTTATLSASGRTLRMRYDAFNRTVATVGPVEQVKQLTQEFLSREGNARDAFDCASPNTNLAVGVAEGGSLETFLNGDEWRARWQATGSPSAWSRANGALTHTGSTSDTLTWRGFTGGSPETAALFFEVQPAGTLSGALGVTFGSGYRIAYEPSSGFSFTAPGGGTVQAPLASPPQLPRQWLLVMGSGVVVFFGDGQLLFSAKVTAGDTGTVAFSTGPNGLSLRNLSMMAGPRVGLTYDDATGQNRQNQQLLGDDALLSAVILDALNRTVAVTRTMPASFGGGASQPVLTYSPTFVDVQGFLDAMDSTWEMTGDIADYYRGQTDGPVKRSDDGGYPYYGYRFEASTRNRRLEQGLPGQPFAVHDVDTTSPLERETIQFAYGANSGSSFNLPAGDFSSDTLISQMKNQSVSLRDTTGRKIASALSDATGAVVGQGQSTVSFAGSSPATTLPGGSSTLNLSQPNAFTTSPQGNPAAFTSSVVQDPLGRTTARTDPDSGTTSLIYDPAMNLRFAQPALDAGQTWFVYYKYDALGRILEEGTVPQAWDPARLAAHAVTPQWPDASVARTVTRTHAYDGDGDDPLPIGQKVSVVTVTQAPTGSTASAITVTETFTYDTTGRTSTMTLATEGQRGTVTYGYDNLDAIVRVTYPAGGPVSDVFYSYDEKGRAIGIGTSAGATDLAAYVYTPDGDVSQELRNGGTLQGIYEYASPGWLSTHAVTVKGNEQPSFSLGYTFFADGSIQTRSLNLAFGEPAAQNDATYAYDGQSRLVSATVAGGQPGNESVGQYDANGNIWSITQDGVPYTFTYAPGTNQLQTQSVNGAPTSGFTWGADGRLLKSETLALDYEPAFNLTRGITVAGNDPAQVRLAYGGQGQRVVKQVSSASSSSFVYFNGLSIQPLARVSGTQWSLFVYGPTGLVAAVSDKRYFPLRDYAHTVWAVVDDQNALVAQYNYRPFGSLAGASGSHLDVIPFLFMGQELDAETGLYNFNARLYSPELRRFLSMDMARQAPSPYCFVGNNPLMMTDPTGNTSTWARVGIGVGMAGVVISSFLLSFVTFGASDAAIAPLETGLLAEETATGATSIAGSQAGAAATEGGGVAASSAVGAGTESAAASSELATGASSGAEAGISSTQAAADLGSAAAPAASGAAGSSDLATSVANFGWQLLTNTMFSMGMSGLQYDIAPGGKLTGKGFGDAMFSGFISGMLYGAFSGFVGLKVVTEGIDKWNPLGRILFKLAANTLVGAGTGDVAQVLTNALEHQPLYQGLALASGIGAGSGLPFGIGDVIKNDFGPAMSLLGVSAENTTKTTDFVNNALKSAKSTTAKVSYGLTAFHLVGGYAAWGAYTAANSSNNGNG
ncbi:MAG TPA: RHS repeat-associated core domain-containing protein [Archangium sp.]|uniref:RHS repeat domain-containing protein n=1 Tax=Archangium sp. TaxID=1872627 RepID=UPI002E369F37|nr:RHS repeat-associated core domain-containing protein [Archangium sp.]HEX5749729.1 RHS repeat-associated core domain-containing protein [Archangium sp.]